MPSISLTRFAIMTALLELLLGSLLHLAPEQLSGHSGHLSAVQILSPILVASGVMLLILIQHPLRQRLRQVVTLCAALPLLAIGAALLATGRWATVVVFMTMGAALAVTPWLRLSGGGRSRFATWTLAVTEGLIGALLLFARDGATVGVPLAGAGQFLAAAAGLAGAAALMLPDRPGPPDESLGPKLRLVLAAALPAAMLYANVTSGRLPVAGVWLAWLLALLPVGFDVPSRDETQPEPEPEPDGNDPFPAKLDGVLHVWMWVFALSVVTLSFLDETSRGPARFMAPAMVGIIACYNTLAYWVFPSVGTPDRRIWVHLNFLVIAIGTLILVAGPLHQIYLMLLVVVPPLAARALDRSKGRTLLVLCIAIIAVSELLEMAQGAGRLAHLLEGSIEALVFWIAANLGLMAAEEQKGHLAQLAAQKQKLAETLAGLELSEGKHRALIEQMQDGFFMVQDGRFVVINPALAHIAGYEPEEVTGSPFMLFLAPEERARVAGFYQRRIDGYTLSNIYETTALHRDGRHVPVRISAGMFLYKGEPATIGTVTDITERKEFEARLIHLADFDPLTDLFNRRRFHEEVEHHILLARRTGEGGAVLFIDLDQFKYINDSLGHHAGDELLKGIAGLLTGRLRRSDIVARLGGDEFAILLPLVDQAGAETVGAELLAGIRNHRQLIDGHEVSVTASIGIALYPQQGTSAGELLTLADLAMYQSKESGRNGVSLYSPETRQLARLEIGLSWERRIREALEQDRLRLLWQPILNLKTGQVTRYELLLRMAGEHGELIKPSEFLAVAERTGQIHAIDRWVVREAIHQIAGARAAGREICLEANLSGRAFTDETLLPLIQFELEATGIPPESLILEITETAAIADISRASHFVKTLRSMGCQFALDDFGSGFSSFTYLKHLEVDYLKIDGSFIQRLSEDPTDQHLVKALADIARRLGKQTVAEFVGNEETVRLLAEYGVEYGQGYFIGQPAPPEKHV